MLLLFPSMMSYFDVIRRLIFETSLNGNVQRFLAFTDFTKEQLLKLQAKHPKGSISLSNFSSTFHLLVFGILSLFAFTPFTL